MPIPNFQILMLPVLRFASDRQEQSKRQFIERLAVEFNLTEAERKELLPSGNEARFDNRVAWTLSHLRKAGLLRSTRRGYVEITDRGLEALTNAPSEIGMKYLMQFPEYVEFRFGSGQSADTPKNASDVEDEIPPHELIEDAYQRLRAALATDLLLQIKASSPSFFERLVVDLLLKMGYGGTRQDAGEAIGKSGDEGIDGIIKEDRLGLDVIYLQAKKWENTVSRPEIQKFVGALHGQRARKGVFITTSWFSSEAIAYARSVESKVILIDGAMLAGLMIDHGVGVTLAAAYEVKRVDSDYFAEE